MPATATCSCLVDDTHPIEAGRLPKRRPGPLLSGLLLLEQRGRLEDAEHGVVLPARSVHEPEHLGRRGLRGDQHPPQQVCRQPVRHDAAPALEAFANSSPAPFMAGITASRERIVARKDEDREGFLRKQGFSKPETAKIIATVLDEEGPPSGVHLQRGRRSFAAVEARAAGYGGIVAVSRATGVAPSTIDRSLKELACGSDLPDDRIRRAGGGRKKLVDNDAGLLDDLLALVSPDERGDPMSALRWTCKSLRRLAAELGALGHRISHTVVGEVLKQQIQPSGQSQDARGGRPSGSGRAVRPHQRQRDLRAGRSAACDLGRNQEEGACRRLQERRARVAAARRSRGGPGA